MDWIIFISVIVFLVVSISFCFTKNTNWEKMAYHDCGYLIAYIPHGNTSFLTNFVKLCPRCGKRYTYPSIKVFTGRWRKDKLETLAEEA